MIQCGKCQSDQVATATLRIDERPELRCDKCFEAADGSLTVYDLLKRIERAARWWKATEIDAGACGTRADFRAAEEAEIMAECVFAAVEIEIERRIKVTTLGLEERNRQLEAALANATGRLRKVRSAIEE